MRRKNRKVLSLVFQEDYKNFQSRPAILDSVVWDANGKQFDVECQQDREWSGSVSADCAGRFFECADQKTQFRVPA